MMHFAVSRLAAGLAKKLSPQQLDRAFAALPVVQAQENPYAPRESARVCALQAEAKVHKTLPAFVADVDGYFAAAARDGADIVCFPELYGLMPLGLLWPVRAALRFAGGRGKTQNSESAVDSAGGGTDNGQKKTVDLQAFFPVFDVLRTGYVEIMVRFAQRYGVYVSCGTLFVPDGGALYNRHILLAPDGSVAGQADKLHRTPDEKALGLGRGNSVTVVDTAVGRVALLVCMDATYFETFRIAKRLGADYAIVPIGDLAAFDPWLALRGAQLRSAETGLPAVKAALVSAPGFPLCFSGRAGVWRPLGGAEKSAETDSHTGRAQVTASISLGVRDDAEQGVFGRKNTVFDRAYADAWIQLNARDGLRDAKAYALDIE